METGSTDPPSDELRADTNSQARTVTLRDETNGADRRFLGASVSDEGNLVIEGHDLGPGTAVVSGDGEYEWTRTVACADLARLRALLDVPQDVDLLEALEKH